MASGVKVGEAMIKAKEGRHEQCSVFRIKYSSCHSIHGQNSIQMNIHNENNLKGDEKICRSKL